MRRALACTNPNQGLDSCFRRIDHRREQSTFEHELPVPFGQHISCGITSLCNTTVCFWRIFSTSLEHNTFLRSFVSKRVSFATSTKPNRIKPPGGCKSLMQIESQ